MANFNEKRNSRLMVTGLFVVVQLLNSCSSDQTTSVVKMGMQVERKSFEAGNRPAGAPGPDKDAETKWEFTCVPELKFNIAGTRKDSAGRDVAIIEVTHAKVILGLPVTVWLPNGASKGLQEHEDGHVAICSRVYQHAEDAAREAVQPVLKTVFEGNGADVESACKDAVNHAGVAIGSEYRRITIERVGRVSRLYDEFSKNSMGSVSSSKLVDDAFERTDVGMY